MSSLRGERARRVYQTSELNWHDVLVFHLKKLHETQQACKGFFLSTPHIFFKPIKTLGYWDAKQNTIALSDVLLKEKDWFVVSGIFLHEMAHQYVTVNFLSTEPHGIEFHKACEIVGVPYEFRTASIGYDGCSVAHHLAHTVENKYFSKMQKLLALSESSNEYESAAAMAKVQYLMGRVQGECLEDFVHKKIFRKALHRGKQRFSIIDSWLQKILTRYFFVEILYSNFFNLDCKKQIAHLIIHGLRENVLMAEYIFHFLIGEIDRLLKNQLKKDKEMSRTERLSYQVGILMGFYEKLESLEQAASQPISVNTKALTLRTLLQNFQKEPALQDYFGHIYGRLGSMSHKRCTLYKDSVDQGMQAGKQISYTKPLETGRRLSQALFYDGD